MIRRHVRAALGLLAGSMALDAQAQEAAVTGPPEAIEEVVVTGFRASLNAALDDKRASSAAIDSIHAEDIAKFPDSNLAESVQRIPGVSIARDAGEGRNISVRGLGPQFTRVRINGMEAQSTTGGTDSSGGSNRNRQFDFNVFASELFNSITARKTSSAEVEEGSLGATIDLRTARPFDYPGLTLVGALKGAYNDLADEVDPRATFLISNTFGDGKFGALFSAAYSERNAFEEGSSTVRWDSGSSVGGFSTASTPMGVTLAQANAATTFHPRIPRYGRLTHQQERLGLTGALQWQIDGANLISFDALYSNYDAKRDENYLEAFSFSRNAAQGGKPATRIVSGELASNGTLVYGLFDGVDIRSESRYDELATKFGSYTLTATHELGDRWSMSELAGYSRSDFNNPIQTTITLDRPNTNGYSWDFRGDDRLPAFDYGYDVNDPANWTFGTFPGGSSEIRIRPQGVDNTFQVGKIDVKFAATDSFALKFGADYKKYDFVSFESRRASETTVPALPAGTTLADLTTLLTGFGSGLDLPADIDRSWLMPDLDAFARTFDIYSNTGMFALGDINNAAARGNNRSVTEQDAGVYLQADFNFDWGIPVRGDLGVRYSRTKQTSQGYLPAGGAPVLLTAVHEYSDVLPSLNLVGEVTPDFLVRLAAAKVMTRPALGQVTPGGTTSLVGNLGVATGNPYLDPTRATTYDLALEWYFDEGALLSGAVFYKDIKTFVQTLVENMPFNQSGYPMDLLAGTTLTGTEVFAFSNPVNTPGGPLEGFEINYQQPFKFLPGAWSNFGVLLNYTYVDSKIDYVTSMNGTTPPVSNDLVNLSKHAWNGTLYYEANDFSARASASYRDRYLTAVPAANAPTIQDADGTNETLNVDLSTSYEVNDHLTISLEGLNLTDEANDQFTDTHANRVVVYTHTGRQVFLGARYKF
ncbi:MAG TPA: TonB-dependent receptor [Steroidobacteraceae bacterium]|nr:TonB-dependent receptor [Steroidobacteraceae bacterium]